MPEEQIQDLYDEVDTHKSGFIDRREFEVLLDRLNPKVRDLNSLSSW